jgi:glycosyltransferase involved in cell wall biosynthesis
MKVTVIIPTITKTADYLLKTTDSLVMNTTRFEPVIKIMLNGPGTDMPAGQCQAVNEAVNNVDTEWIMVCNDDFYFAPGWDKGLSFTHPCFSPNWIEPMEVGSAPPFLKLDGGSDLETFKQEVVDNFVSEHGDMTVENGFNLGFFIKTDIFRKIGGYDIMYDPYGSNSDSDLQYKLEIAGVQPKRCRGALIYHFGSKSDSVTPDKQVYWQKNYDYFTEKWGIVRADSPDIWYHNLKIPIDQLKYRPDWSIYAS